MKPFEGIRVLDLTHVFAGPFCTYQLAVMGADVIKIESPDTPDMSRTEGEIASLNAAKMGSYYQTQSSNKRAIILDLKTREGKENLTKLIKTADVLVENYSGKALERLGFGYEEVSQINPDIIYCSMSGYGKTGPKAEHPAYDLVIQAYSGLMYANGTPETTPIKVGPAVVDYGTGAQAACAISAALFQRTRTNKGQYIDVSMLDSALMLMASTVTATLTNGKPPTPHGNHNPAYAAYSLFETKEGYIVIGAWTNKQMADLFKAIGEPERAGEILATPRENITEKFESDTAIISAAMQTKTADEWEQCLNEAHVPAGRVRHMDEALASDQIATRNVIQISKLENHPNTPTKLPVAGFQFAHGGPEITSAPPQYGEHTDEVLDELD